MVKNGETSTKAVDIKKTYPWSILKTPGKAGGVFRTNGDEGLDVDYWHILSLQLGWTSMSRMAPIVPLHPIVPMYRICDEVWRGNHPLVSLKRFMNHQEALTKYSSTFVQDHTENFEALEDPKGQ